MSQLTTCGFCLQTIVHNGKHWQTIADADRDRQAAETCDRSPMMAKLHAPKESVNWLET